MMAGPRMPGVGFTGAVGFRPGEDFTGSGGAAVRTGETVTQVQDTAKMVELTVYGIATLYERFPAPAPKPETPK
jgi:hypothetical protein